MKIVCALTLGLCAIAFARADVPVPIPGDGATAKEVLDAEKWGLKLYTRKKYEEALPYLHAAATRGQKEAQATLGGLYLYGKGVKRNDLLGLGWLGVAARGETTPVITELFGKVWDKVPEKAAPQVIGIIDEFERKYGEATIECRPSRQAGSHISVETCEYGDKWDTLQELEKRLENQSTMGTRRFDGEIGVAGGGGGI
jgi:hypothetical protein